MTQDICIKVISKNPLAAFQFFDLPQHSFGTQARVRFTLDSAATDYDWLVVYDDLPPRGHERLPNAVMRFHCPQSQTVLLTYEPPSVKYYGQDYVNQFGMVLTAHPADALPHRNRHIVPPIGFWYYGGLAEIEAHPTPPPKSHTISLFHSEKRQSHTLHRRRFDFLHAIADGLGDTLHAYGRGIRPVIHKAEALDGYRYHVAVENHIGAHHWTEKLSDCFLGYCLPFYVGCPNAADYFPPESFIPIDIRNPAHALETMRTAIANNEYEKRLPAIAEARRRVIEDYNLGNMIARHIVEQSLTPQPPIEKQTKKQSVLYSRHACMRRTPLHLLRYGLGKLARQRHNRRYWRDY